MPTSNYTDQFAPDAALLALAEQVAQMLQPAPC